ncbi:MAG: c-type cytochrome, methanol metabolism-related [Hyphomicrobium sp.]
MRRISFAVVAAMMFGGVLGSAAMAEDVQPGLQKEVTLADGCISQEGAEFKDGKWVLPDGTPTFHVCHKDGGTYVVDWATYNGYRRYHGECHVCHGPNGLGSTYAPALADSLKTMDYGTFLGTVASGRTRDEAGTKFVMPAFGDNRNVMCFINDLYAYLKARATGALPAGQLGGRNRDEKPQQARDEEKACLG